MTKSSSVGEKKFFYHFNTADGRKDVVVKILTKVKMFQSHLNQNYSGMHYLVMLRHTTN